MQILKFYSPNCHACLKLDPVIEKTVELFKDAGIALDFINYDTKDKSNQNILEKYQIKGRSTLLPCLIFVNQNQTEIGRINGQIKPKELISLTNQMLLKLKQSQLNITPSQIEQEFNQKSEIDRQEIADFVAKTNQAKKDNPLDLSADEDLSIAIMNLISIEEHLFFSANKTSNPQYYELLKEVREVRKRSLGLIITEYEGEVWCISKHLLAASMRLMEVGTKQLGRGNNEESEKLFADSYRLYLLFWALNSGLINSKNIQKQGSDQIQDYFEDNVDCCKE
jgi:thiol-disulfide isomerase/thioredoxin